MPPPGPAAAAVYVTYARNNPAGGMRVEELRALMSDLGLLAGRSQTDADAFVVKQFALADRESRDGRLDVSEFAAFYTKVTAPRLLDVLRADMPAELEQLRAVFLGFAAFGAHRGSAAPTELDGARFIKLCRETGLVGGWLTNTDCDLIFTKAKERAARRISFEQFLDTLDMMAAKKGAPVAEVVCQVAEAGGPAANGVTTAAFVRFHDDQSTYTGVYARRSSLASQGSQQACQSSATAPQGEAAGPHRRSSTGAGRPATPAEAVTPCGGRRLSSTAGTEALCTPGVDSTDRLRDTFRAFASFGLGSSPAGGKAGREMDSKQFVKLCRDCGILGGPLTTTAADLAFVANAKSLGGRRMGFSSFLAAVEQLARHKGVPQEELLAAIARCPGPSLRGALTPDQTSDPFTARHAAGAAAPVQAAGQAAAVEPSRGGGLDTAPQTGVEDAAGRDACAPASLATDMEAPAGGGDVAQPVAPAVGEVAAAVGKLSIGGGRVIRITASAV